MIDIIKELQDGEESFSVKILDTGIISVYKGAKHYIGYRFHYISNSWISNKGRTVSDDDMIWFIKHY